MIKQFKPLNDEEIELMGRAPILIAILVAGADNKIDKSEIKEALQISKYKPIKGRDLLVDFYKAISGDFEFNLIEEIASLPREARKRNPFIIAELEKLNKILPKLDRKFAIQFYESMKDIAKRIAKASGGVLGYISVDYQESKLMELKRIKNPSNYK
jgi:hypothetical protein